MKRKKGIVNLFLICILLLASLLTVGCGNGYSGDDSSREASSDAAEDADSSSKTAEEEPVELTILAAASLTDVCNEIKAKYEAEHENVTLNFSYGGSGALQTQIEEGAPADVFLSAATKQMAALDEQGLMDSGSIVQLLENKVVLVVPAGNVVDSTNTANESGVANLTADSDVAIITFEDVVTDKVTMIGLGEPGSVPVGQYSEEIFENMGILDVVKTKANYGLDVRTVLSWVETGEVDCGIVYATDAYSSDSVKIVAEAPEGSCKQVIYPAGIVKSTENAEAAAEFMAYLQKEEVLALFESYGFTALK